MTESADLKIAADRLQRALQSLEESLEPIVHKVRSLEQSLAEAGDFDTDRATLASQLDEAVAREQENDARTKELEARDQERQAQAKEFEAREKEFSDLAQETTQELDRVIRQVKHVLEGEH